MYWNYRVVKSSVNGETLYAVHEAFYKESLEPDSITENPITIYAESLEGLRQNLELILKALDKPILDYDSFKDK